MARDYCSSCRYPTSVCLCDAIENIESPRSIILLVHPKEVNHPKNTGRLVQLCIENTAIHIGETSSDFENLQSKITADPSAYCLVYPSDNSRPLEPAIRGNSSDNNATDIKHWIFIDSTWRKAFKMYQLNTWLHALPQWHFKCPPDGHYTIRKTSQDSGLSTLEAVAYCLQLTTSVNTQPLTTLFTAMQKKHYRPL